MKVLVLNSHEDSGRIYGNALSTEQITPIYVDDRKAAATLFLDKEKPDLVLLSLEWLPFQRIVAVEARKRNIPVLYVMDGVIEWSYIWNNHSFVLKTGTVLQPLIANHISVIGRHQARILSAMGLGDKISVIGLPRLDGFSIKRVIQSRQRPTLLICCARTPAHNNDHHINVIRALSDIKKLTDKLNIDCVWRITNGLAQALGVRAANGHLTKLLATSSAMIAFPSTIALEGMLSGLPTAIIEYRPVPIYIDTAWEIRSCDHIYPVINELLYPPAEKMAYQAYCLEEELSIGNATENLRNLILKLGNGEYDDSRTQPQSAYGPLDFKLVHSQISCFSSSATATLQYASDAYMKKEKELYEWSEEVKSTLVIKFIRLLRKAPLFRKINRLLDLI